MATIMDLLGYSAKKSGGGFKMPYYKPVPMGGKLSVYRQGTSGGKGPPRYGPDSILPSKGGAQTGFDPRMGSGGWGSATGFDPRMGSGGGFKMPYYRPGTSGGKGPPTGFDPRMRGGEKGFLETYGPAKEIGPRGSWGGLGGVKDSVKNFLDLYGPAKNMPPWGMGAAATGFDPRVTQPSGGGSELNPFGLEGPIKRTGNKEVDDMMDIILSWQEEWQPPVEEDLGPTGWDDILPAIGRGLGRAAEGLTIRNLLSGIMGEEYATEILGPDQTTEEYWNARKSLTGLDAPFLPFETETAEGYNRHISNRDEYIQFLQEEAKKHSENIEYQEWLEDQQGMLDEEEPVEPYPYYGYGYGGGWGGSGGWGGWSGGGGYEQEDWMNWFKNMYWNVD